MEKLKNDIDFYKSYIGKEVVVQGRKSKITAVRQLDSGMILIEYDIGNSKKGVINAELVKL